jgi:UDP-N-acetylglucosamine diphosphorylase / glucose-1-phosphate thymidylyltransferase / UDP-N-acetylgalactosamine diphosphorylase / glucosamine-1-phosphate N-acetyltransferase / galactosamine-1-phosphate N-acetyltransferase
VSGLYLLEPEAPGPEWAPFAGVRPIAETRAGAWLIRERWEAAARADTIATIGAHVEGFHEAGAAPVRADGPIEGPALIASSCFAPTGSPITPSTPGARYTYGGTTIAWTLGPREQWKGRHERGPAVEVDGLLLRGAFDLVTALEVLLPADCADFVGTESSGVPEGSIVLGDPARVVCRRASVEPGVVFDVRAGAVVLREGVEVRHGTRLEGPVFAGPGTRIHGGVIRGCAFGPDCRVHGELSSTVFTGYDNKSHDGFVGHSVLAPWVNLGAGTITSNLKNTYGPVRLDVRGSRIETERLNLGTLFGDHAKTAIGTMLSTGTVVSAGANVFGEAAPKYVPPFAWGSSGMERLSEEGFLRIAERVLGRRNVAFTTEQRDSLRRMYARGTTE